jgi:hypothetical protein
MLLTCMQAPAAAARPHGRSSQAGLTAVLGLSMALQLVTVDAAANVCASIKPVW